MPVIRGNYKPDSQPNNTNNQHFTSDLLSSDKKILQVLARIEGKLDSLAEWFQDNFIEEPEEDFTAYPDLPNKKRKCDSIKDTGKAMELEESRLPPASGVLPTLVAQ